ncbi:MAG TPA: hypothetical protein VLW52_02105 [Opitutaceae bacterium]|nr:hypothetical protein [Opitutaceae bacterium]
MSLFSRSASRSWLIALLVVLGFVAWDAGVRIRRIEGLSGRFGVTVDPPAADSSSPTGYALGRRPLVLPEVGDDGYQWIMQTQTMLAEGKWRIHWADYDNAPRGRAVHWAAPFHWWLALLAWADHVGSGRLLGASVERAALLANPVLLGVFLLAVLPVVARRFGSSAASLLATGMVSTLPFSLYFAADYPDHHGMLEACAMLTVLCLLAGGGGWLRPEPAALERLSDVERALAEWLPGRRAARRWFAASAVAGGVGLWISAASQVPVLVGVGAGAIGAAWLGRGRAKAGGWASDPALWRLWGAVGCVTSIAAYLVEYFPSQLGFRLEVNHPLYGLAWIGAGELLCRLTRGLGEEGFVFSRRGALVSALAFLAVALLPVVILLTASETFVVADRFVWQLGTEYVAEGQSVASYLATSPGGFTLVARGLPLLAIVAAAILVGRGKLAAPWKAQLVMALAPALLLLALACREIRWWGQGDALALALVAMLVTVLTRGLPGSKAARLGRLACALLFLPGAFAAIRSTVRSGEYTKDDILQLAERDFAHWLRLRMGRDAVVVAAAPTATVKLIYHGGFQGLGTLTWENVEGFRHGAEIFAASSPDRAHELVRRYGVTHFVLLSWDSFAEEYVRMYLGLSPGQAVPGGAFILGLLHGKGVPPWLRLVPYPLPKHEALRGQSIVVLEVTPPQAPEAAVAHTAEYLVEMDRPELAVELLPALQQAAHYYPALVTLAYVQARTGAEVPFAATVAQVVKNLPSAAGLNLEDRIRLATVLAVGGRAELAGEQLRRCMIQLDERALRRLPVGTLADFLDLTGGMGVPIPDGELGRLAFSLLPPYRREKH